MEFPGADGKLRKQYRVAISRNAVATNAYTWFRENVDPEWVLLGKGTFVPRLLPNGMTAFLYTGAAPLPENYDPVSSLYAVSASGQSVLVIGAIGGNTIALPLAVRTEAFAAIASSMQLP